jgi:hypothetical protein
MTEYKMIEIDSECKCEDPALYWYMVKKDIARIEYCKRCHVLTGYSNNSTKDEARGKLREVLDKIKDCEKGFEECQ